MKPTFPVRSFPWAHYLPAVLFCAAATVISAVVYGELPGRLATSFDFEGTPTGWMTKRSYVTLMLGAMWGMLAFLLALDRLLAYRSFPAPVLSAVTGGTELFLLAIHLGTIRLYRLEGVHALIVLSGILALFTVYVAVHCLVARTGEDEPPGPPLWVDFTPHGLLDTVLFFVRPFLPGEVRAYEEGLVLRAWLYTFFVPWDTIEALAHATVWEAVGGMAVRVASSPSRAVKLKLSGTKLPLIFSVEHEDRLIEEWERRRARPDE